MVESEDVKKAEIDRLYKENVSKVYRTALYYVEDHYVAEEIVQEVFLKLYDNLGDICMESVPAWLITTAKNMAKNYLRDSKWETPMEEVPEQEVPYSSEGLDAQLIEVLRQKECRELHDTIFADLYEKNSRWYEAVTVSYTLDKPQKEVADKMGISVDTLYMLWSSIFVTLMANKIGGLQFGIYRNCQISSRVFHTAVAALPLTKANRSDFE